MISYFQFPSRKEGLPFLGLIAIVFAFSFCLRSSAQTLPPGFQRVLVSSSFIYPSAITFAKDGRIFVATQTGVIRIIKNGTVLSTPFLRLNVGFKGESGLIGITLDPDFANNQYVYVHYTLSDGSRNRVSRFKANGDVGIPTSEEVLLNLDLNLGRTNHMGGALEFGKDGKLYVAVGDKTVPTTSPDLDTYFGKLLRINSDGSVPSGNPYTTGSEQRRRIWAHGLRNPFTFDIQPVTGKIFVNDVGNSSWEEVNNVSTGGKNFGWPSAEGMSTNSAYVNPVITYPHGIGANKGCAITGGVFFNPSQTNYPAQYIGKYFFQDHCNAWIDYFDPSASSPSVSHFGTNCGEQILGLNVGTDGNLYYFERTKNSLYKIVYSNVSAPTIVSHPTNKTVSEGQSVSFSVTATGSAPLTYQWQKNGTNISGANSSTYSISNTTVADEGDYRVRVSNNSGSATSNSAHLTVTDFNAPPEPIISTPVAGTQFRGGMTIQFSGTGTDPEDGTLPASAFTWFMTLHHNDHIHEIPPIATGVKSGQHTFSVSDETSDNIFYRLTLQVKDSKGSVSTVFRDILPFKTTLSFATQPGGLKITLDGTPISTPLSVVGVEGVERILGVVQNQSLGGANYVFSHWLHGGNATQTISTPTDNTTYTAVYIESSGGCQSSGTVLREVWTSVYGKSVSLIPVNTTPSTSHQITSLETRSTGTDFYGQRLRGYICPPVSGNYTFYISGDDNVELWLSTTDSPSGKTRIAHVTGETSYTTFRQWTKYPTQTSATKTLQQGQRYYVEVLQKESAGGDHVSVGWKIPGSATIDVISGGDLSPVTVSNSCASTGTILKEVWTNVGGKAVSLIPTNKTPNTSQQISSLQSTTFGDTYGLRIRGFICPPSTGNYRFYISGDDNVELWLSTDNSPSNKVRIADVTGETSFTYLRQWTKFSSQQSPLISLQQGKSYYIEALQKEHGGGDHVSVGWIIPGSTTINVIDGSYLSPWTSSVANARLFSADNSKAKPNLIIYPSPSDGRVTTFIADGLESNEKATMLFYNQLGILEETRNLQADETGLTRGEINTENKGSGVFTIVLGTSREKITERLLILK